jgi:hypothetical protein
MRETREPSPRRFTRTETRRKPRRRPRQMWRGSGCNVEEASSPLRHRWRDATSPARRGGGLGYCILPRIEDSGEGNHREAMVVGASALCPCLRLGFLLVSAHSSRLGLCSLVSLLAFGRCERRESRVRDDSRGQRQEESRDGDRDRCGAGRAATWRRPQAPSVIAGAMPPPPRGGGEDWAIASSPESKIRGRGTIAKRWWWGRPRTALAFARK